MTLSTSYNETLMTQHSTVRDFVTLMKPGVMTLVVFTGFVGMMVAPGKLHLFLQLIALLCIALGSGAGGAINMWFDRDIDAVMLRTLNRPLPAGRITPSDALAFGSALALLSVVLMGLAVGWVAGFALAFAIAFYVFVYTMWLKRSTPQNIVIGGAAGAFPPVIGWAAVTGGVSLESFVLFMIIFMWTPPHFWALALYRNGDYKRAGVPMLPVVAGLRVTKNHILAYSLLLLPLTLAPVFIGMASLFYGVGASVLGVVFCALAYDVWRREEGDTPARRLFGYSIFYLFALFSVLLVDHALFA